MSNSSSQDSPQKKEGVLAGKTAFIAGASGGINLAIAQELAAQGASTVVISRSEERIQSAADAIRERGGQALGIAADVRDSDAVAAAFKASEEAYGPIDIVVSGAAGNFLAPALNLSPNAFKTVVDIDLNGTYNVFKAAWPHLRKPGSSLIAITAPQAVRPTMFQAHACAAKAGVNMLTKVLAMEWGPAGVRVNAISPGFIEGTEGTSRLVDTDTKLQELVSSIPLRKLGQTSDIANLAVFLCLEQAQYINGAILDCDGGFVLGSSEADALRGDHIRDE